MKKELFEKVVRDNQTRLFNYLLKFVRQKEDAEDLTQSVFLKFYAKMDDVEDGKELAYLYRAARNQAINYLNKKKKITSAPDFVIDNIYAPSEEEYIYMDVVKKAIVKLPPKVAMLIELQYYQKLSYKEMADTLGCSVKALESKLVRAKKRLRKIIEKEIEVSNVNMIEGVLK